MKHAGSEAIARLELLLTERRERELLKEKRPDAALLLAPLAAAPLLRNRRAAPRYVIAC